MTRANQVRLIGADQADSVWQERALITITELTEGRWAWAIHSRAYGSFGHSDTSTNL